MGSFFFQNSDGGGGGETGFYPHPLYGSLRFNDDDGAYLSRTYTTSATSTFHCKIKRGNLGTIQPILGSHILFNADDTLSAFGLTTSEKFRDPFQWLHLTVSDNGLEVNGTNLGALTTVPVVNAAIGFDGANYADFYLAYFILVDGFSHDETSFGYIKDGVFVGIDYSDAYGTAGCKLLLDSDANDSSGNDNHWTANNIVSSDYVLCCPSKNFCTWNSSWKDNEIALSNGNLEAYSNSSNALGIVAASFAIPDSGLWYFEGMATENNMLFGITNEQSLMSAKLDGLLSDKIFCSPYGSITIGTVYMVAVDGSTGDVWTGVNGVWSSGDPTTLTTPAGNISGVLFAFFQDNWGSQDAGIVANFGQDASFAGNKSPLDGGGPYSDSNGNGSFFYQPPSGYQSICSDNLSAIPTPFDAYVDPATENDYVQMSYIGNGGASLFIWLGFCPSNITIDGIHYDKTNVNIEFLSNGIKLLNATNNTNSTSYTLEAWVDQDFKYANAQVI